MSWHIRAVGWDGERIELEVVECGICYALVENDSWGSHGEWHSSLSESLAGTMGE